MTTHLVHDPYALEDADPDCLPPDAASALLRDAPWRRMVVVGDSVAEGIRDPVAGYRDAGCADRVGEALGRVRADFAYRNLGVRDLRLAGIRDGRLATALAFRPDLALVVAGGNDAFAREYAAGRVRTGLLEIVRPLARAGALVVTIGLFDLPRSGLLPPHTAAWLTERFDELDAITASVAAEVGGLHVDTHHHPRGADQSIYGRDGIHANARGHAIACAAIVRALSAYTRPLRDPR